jgi:hypothetical protein
MSAGLARAGVEVAHPVELHVVLEEGLPGEREGERDK